jgi:hypothetical protein
MHISNWPLISLVALATAAPAAPSAQGALSELLSAEHAFSKAAAAKPPADGIGAMLGDDVILMTRGGPVRGHDAALASLAANPANKGTGASWHSIRSGVSADGQHGFTMGYLDLAGGDAALAHRRYLAYWIHGTAGWRVAAFKQAIRGADEVEIKDQGTIVPTHASTPAGDSVESLIAAEQSFSDRAQKVGLYQAFDEFGRQDAMHLVGKGGFAVGRAAIAENVGDPKEHSSPVKWSADSAIVAPSGDLGVTIGTIKTNAPPPEGQPGEIPFFTIWQRDSVDQPWRYIAE